MSSSFALIALSAGLLPLLAAAWWWLRKRRYHKAAQARLDWEDYPGAAVAFERAGNWERAAEIYATLGEPVRAIELYLRAGEEASAVRTLISAPARSLEGAVERLELAGLLADTKRQIEVGERALAVELPTLAITYFERAGDRRGLHAAKIARAREMLAHKQYAGAALLFDELGEHAAADRAFLEGARIERDAVRKGELARHASSRLLARGAHQEAAEALRLCGDDQGAVELLLKAKDSVGAANVCMAMGEHARAAQLFESTGDLLGAGKAMLANKSLTKAAEYFARAGEMEQAVLLLMEGKEHQAAARLLVKAGELKRAGELLAGAGDFESAVRLFLAHHNLDLAIELLSRHGKLREAAALLTQHGHHDRASVLLAEAGDARHQALVAANRGDYEGAARAWLDAGLPSEARMLLSRITTPSPNARFLMGRALMELGQPEQASAHFSALLSTRESPVPRCEVLYCLARTLETLQRDREALTTYEEIVVADPDMRDAFLRMKMIRARIESVAPTGVGDHVSGVGLPSEWGGSPFSRGPGSESNPFLQDPANRLAERYRFDAELGRGSAGVVYRARDLALERDVAIKVLDAKANTDARMREYFLREARAIAQMGHPNIVTLFDAGLQESAPYLVMELVDGEDLRTRIQRGPLEISEATRIISAIASALEYAHSRRIVHRDVKPENIVLGSEGSTKLMDFGVAFVIQDSLRKATMVGTPVYMAPEQIRGEELGGFTDVYALGTVLYECLVGAPPFGAEGVLFHHINTVPTDLRKWRPEVPPALAATVMTCLAKAPADRPTSTQLVKALKRV